MDKTRRQRFHDCLMKMCQAYFRVTDGRHAEETEEFVSALKAAHDILADITKEEIERPRLRRLEREGWA